MPQPNKLYPTRIRIIATGGTIDKIYFDARSTFQVGDPQVVEVLQDANVAFQYDVESICRKDSLDLTDEDRQQIRNRVACCDESHVLVTHGTDTMIETAQVLQSVPDKVIVLTGAMQPARLRKTDALFNVGCAVMALQLLDPGVHIVMNGRVFDPNHVRKNWEAQRFEEA